MSAHTRWERIRTERTRIIELVRSWKLCEASRSAWRCISTGVLRKPLKETMRNKRVQLTTARAYDIYMSAIHVELRLVAGIMVPHLFDAHQVVPRRSRLGNFEINLPRSLSVSMFMHETQPIASAPTPLLYLQTNAPDTANRWSRMSDSPAQCTQF